MGDNYFSKNTLGRKEGGGSSDPAINLKLKRIFERKALKLTYYYGERVFSKGGKQLTS